MYLIFPVSSETVGSGLPVITGTTKDSGVEIFTFKVGTVIVGADTDNILILAPVPLPPSSSKSPVE